MRSLLSRTAVSAIVAGACAALLAFAPIPTGHAVTALIMGGTGQPDPGTIPHFLTDTARLYIDPTSVCKVDTCQLVSLPTPEQLWPFVGSLTLDKSVAQGVTDLNGGLLNYLVGHPDEPVVVSGTSQSSVIASIEKRNLAKASAEIKSQLQFVLTANPNRPNGGLLERFAGLSIPILEFTFNGPSPTDTGIATTDISFQYDIAADFPRYPLNLFALLNTLAGIDIHGSYVLTRDGYTEEELLAAIADPANRQTLGDTTYITIPTKNLPLVKPLRDFGIATGTTALTTPLADLIEPTLRVLVELGYDRSIGYGTPAPAGLFPTIDPAKLAADLSVAADKGVKAALADIQAAPATTAVTRAATTPALRTSAPKTKAPRVIKTIKAATSEHVRPGGTHRTRAR